MLQKTIIAVGGGEIGRIERLSDGTCRQTDVETTLIDRFIIQSSGKKSPSLLFIGTATRDSPDYLSVVKDHFQGRLGCLSVEPLNLVAENLSSEQIKEKIFAADIIYVGGGDTTFMLKIWKDKGLDQYLYDAYQKGIVMAGISAGAICWFEYYDNMDDIDNLEQLDIISGLGFIKGFGVPHYNQLSVNVKNMINDKLKARNIKGWSIDDCSAIAFQNEMPKIISCKNDSTANQIP